MIVILDTSILRQDLLLRSPKIDLLLDFLTKTHGKLKVPNIVYQEIRSLYVRELQRHQNHLEKSRRTLQDLMMDQEISNFDLDVDAHAEKYVRHLRERLRLGDDDIVPYKNDYLPEVVRRATERLHPFTDERKEFRDVLLWLTTLDICDANPKESVCMVSANTKDFADKEGENLHPFLAGEATDKGARILYFPTLDDFLKAHATRFEFITREWILEQINVDSLKQEVERQLKLWEGSRFQRYIEHHEDDEFYDPSLVSVLSFDLSEYYCLGMTDGSIRIQATFESECEVEYRSYREEEEEYSDYDYDFDHLKGDWDWTYVTKTRHVPVEEMRYAYLWVESLVDIEVKDHEVEDIDVIDCYLQ